MITFELLGVALLIPELKKFGTAVVLQGLEVSIDADVGHEQMFEDSFRFVDRLRIHEDGSNQRFKYVSKYLKVVFIEHVQVEGHVPAAVLVNLLT